MCVSHYRNPRCRLLLRTERLILCLAITRTDFIEEVKVGLSLSSNDTNCNDDEAEISNICKT